MTYTSLLDLFDAVLSIPDMNRWDAEVIKLGELIRVYHDALDNPPEGVVGVGAVTYAEEVLIEYQQG